MMEEVSFYRCTICHRVVSPWDIAEKGGYRNCGGTRIAPTNLSMVEKVVQIAKHPRVWTWKNELPQ